VNFHIHFISFKQQENKRINFNNGRTGQQGTAKVHLKLPSNYRVAQ